MSLGQQITLDREEKLMFAKKRAATIKKSIAQLNLELRELQIDQINVDLDRVICALDVAPLKEKPHG